MATNVADKKILVTRVGIVEGDKRNKSRKVVLPNDTTHAKYGKIIRRRTVLHVHDETNQSRTGDLVEVRPCRPRSRTKHWELVRVVEKGVALQFEAVEAPATKPVDGAATPAGVTPAKGAPTKAGPTKAAPSKADAKTGAKAPTKPTTKA